MEKIAFTKVFITYLFILRSLWGSDIFINEIDYDDPGGDNEEFVEICALAGTYNNVSLYFINGSNGSSYDNVTFGNITISDENSGYGFYILVTTSNNTDGSSIYDHNTGVSSIQNGAPDGIYLKVDGTIVDGISYEDTGDPLNSDMEQTNISGETSADKSIGRSGLDGSSWILQDRSPGLANNVSGSNDQTLPVELLKWYGRATNTYIQLNWETASEIDNLGFLIYKGVVGNPLTLWQDYRSNPSLNGQGSTSFHTKYSLLDRSVIPDQTYAYLLSDVDIHGIETRHDTIEVKLNRKKQFTVYSNPTNPEVEMVLNLESDFLVQIDIYNIMGHHVESVVQNRLHSGEYLFKWIGSKVSSGFYMVTLRIDGHLASSHKITILK